MVYAGAIIVRGRGKAVVVGTGVATGVGQLALDMMSATGGKPPLLERMEKFTKVVAYAVLIAASTIAVIGMLFRGYGLHDMFLFGVALLSMVHKLVFLPYPTIWAGHVTALEMEVDAVGGAAKKTGKFPDVRGY